MESEQAADPVKTTFNILFVCTGNTCRSPMAEAVARDELARRGWQHVRVGSAGTAAENGVAASVHAVSVTRRRGMDLARHRSRRLTPELVEWADLILVMSPSHLGAVARLGGEEKAALLGDFALGEEGVNGPVSDPFGGDEIVYARTLEELRRLVRGSLERLAPILHP